MGKIKLLFAHSSVRQWVGLLVLFGLSVGSMNLSYQPDFLYGDLTKLPAHAPFDGTVPPISTIPNWTKLNSTEYYAAYSDIPASKFIDLPEYRNDYLTFDSAQLIWGNASHEVIRNTKISFPVPWSGNYRLDDSGKGAGSHPAVDIKAPKGTPVYAIANGTVSKIKTDSGFGKHIVIEHRNVPSPDQPKSLTTLYSSYSHLDQYFVTEGQVLKKGDLIGEVGDTGTATTHHLHFQLENALAPWHPYWPFTSAEAAAAGYGFWDAVNNGVGINNLYAYTYDPMEWVQEHYNANSSAEAAPAQEVATVTEVVSVSEADFIPSESTSSVVSLDFESIEMQVDFVAIGENQTVSIRLLDSDGNAISKPRFDGRIQLSLSDTTVARLNRNFLEAIDFKTGSAQVKLYGDRLGTTKLSLSIGGEEHISSDISIVDPSGIQDFDHFGWVASSTYVPGLAQKVTIQTLDANGRLTLGFKGDGALVLSTLDESGTFQLNGETVDRVFRTDFVGGTLDLDFIGNADSTSSTLIATYGKKRAEHPMTAQLFSDFTPIDPFYSSVAYLYKRGTIQGYNDGTFQAARTVSRVEALKLIFLGLDRQVKDVGEVDRVFSFPDASTNEWYANVLATAYDLQIVNGYPDGSFGPNNGVNRVEFLKMLFASLDIQVGSAPKKAPYSDVNVSEWHAPYVEYAKSMNIFPVEGNSFYPSRPMTRSEVAELIYRLIAVKQNGNAPYASSMQVQ